MSYYLLEKTKHILKRNTLSLDHASCARYLGDTEQFNNNINEYKNIIPQKKKPIKPQSQSCYDDEDYGAQKEDIILHDKPNKSFQIKKHENCYKISKTLQIHWTGKKVLLLDLDNTLVASCLKLLPEHNQRYSIIYPSKDTPMYIYQRPYLQQFLVQMAKLYDIGIFTASIEKYTNDIIDQIDKDHLITFRLFRKNCQLSSKGKYLKDISILGRDIKDIVIIDNNPYTYSLHKQNGLPIKSWFGKISDIELFKIVNMMTHLAFVNDVREFISKVVTNNRIDQKSLDEELSKQSKKLQSNQSQADLQIPLAFTNKIIKKETQVNKKKNSLKLESSHINTKNHHHIPTLKLTVSNGINQSKKNQLCPTKIIYEKSTNQRLTSNYDTEATKNSLKTKYIYCLY